MRDVMSPDSERHRALVDVFAEEARLAGYGHIMSPIVEELGVFLRVGESTDVVTKEMYDFEDKDNARTRIALRPELTASVVRAFVQHNPRELPWKVWYEGPQFRRERPKLVGIDSSVRSASKFSDRAMQPSTSRSSHWDGGSMSGWA